MIVIVKSIESIFSNTIQNLLCQENTKAYIANVFNLANKEKCDYSKESVTLIYSRAKFEYKFDLFQNLADWILYSSSLFPESLSGASDEYYQAIARDSYYRCYKMINKKWVLFEELADRFPALVTRLQSMDLKNASPSTEYWSSLSVHT